MKISKRQLRRIINEEKQKLLEENFSGMGEDDIIDALSPEEYHAFEALVYTLGQEVFGLRNMTSEDAAYSMTVLLQRVFPLLANPIIKKHIR